MKTTHYAVIEKASKFPPAQIVAFADKDKADKHMKLLNDAGGSYSVVEVGVDFLIK